MIVNGRNSERPKSTLEGARQVTAQTSGKRTELDRPLLVLIYIPEYMYLACVLSLVER